MVRVDPRPRYVPVSTIFRGRVRANSVRVAREKGLVPSIAAASCPFFVPAATGFAMLFARVDICGFPIIVAVARSSGRVRSYLSDGRNGTIEPCGHRNAKDLSAHGGASRLC